MKTVKKSVPPELSFKVVFFARVRKVIKRLIIFLSVAVVVIAIFAVGIVLYNASFKPTGQMIMFCNDGFFQYDLANQTTKLIFVPKTSDTSVDYYDVDYNIDRTRFLLCRQNSDISTGTYCYYFINEVNVQSGNSHEICEFNDSSGKCSDVQYTPNSNEISFCLDNNLWIYNLNSKTKRVLLSDCVDYSWDMADKSLIYQDNKNHICKYDIASGISKKLLDGNEPVVSDNGRYIACISDSSHIIVYDTLLSRAIYNVNYDNIDNIRFSANNKYLIVGYWYWLLGGGTDCKNILIDIKTGHQKTLFGSSADHVTTVFDVK